MTRLIKKYKNRRLYDTEISQYITVEELQRYVTEAIPFRVEDSQTGNDLTCSTLLQIFVEMEGGVTQFLSADMLKQLIIMAHHPMNEFFKTMMQRLFSTMDAPMQNNTYLTDYQKITDDWQKKFNDMLKQWPGYL